MKIQIDNIHSFIAAAENGSFSAAGRKLNKTQAAISLSIQNLEADLGYSLFDRSRRYPVLTEKGKCLLKGARMMVSQYNSFVEQSRNIFSVNPTNFSVGIDPLVCTPEVIDILNDFSKLFPTIRVKLVQQSSRILHQQMESEELDMAIGLFEASDRTKLNCVSGYYVNFSWVASPRYYDQNLSNMLTYEEFCNMRILAVDGINSIINRDVCDAFQVWEVQDTLTALSLCKNGVGLACLPDFIVSNDIDSQHLTKIPLAFDKLNKSYCRTSTLLKKTLDKSPSLSWLQHKISNIDRL
ncbi:LysR family transcriptional regulator [Vibrio nomapromontoriensis]|uniref:LysR family transcriptional regulator n=1 Tax=Vibrio nomapromontoriensis TaxID=2910246 RepID=UPI003D0E90F9